MARKPSPSMESEPAMEVAVPQSGKPQRNTEIELLEQTIDELRARDAKREQEMCQLSEAVSRLSQMSAIECILTNGFEEMSSKLAPLAQIGSQHVPIECRDVNARLASMIASTDRARWAAVSTVPIKIEPVPFIGEIVPPARDKGGY
jgi:hypothetical protein